MGSVGVFPFFDCPKPVGASDWTVVVSFAQGANSQVSFRNFVPDAAGNWGGQFTIPVGAALGAAQLTAQCFDPTHTSQDTFDYSPVPFTVDASAFSATPATVAVGSSIRVADVGPCPAPASTNWTVLVSFAQGSNDQVSSRNYGPDAAGAWAGTFTVPIGAVPGAAHLTARCFDASHASPTTVEYGPMPLTVVVDTTPPVLHLPATRTVNATGRTGARVAFVVTATDDLDPTPKVSCTPPSGSLFAIGTRTVACAASDRVGNLVTGQLTIKVLGASSQLTNLITTVRADKLRASLTTTLVADLSAARSALANHAKTRACTDMAAFIRAVRAATGHGITKAKATALVSAATRIRNVIGC
jgi:hypothetical protein